MALSLHFISFIILVSLFKSNYSLSTSTRHPITVTLTSNPLDKVSKNVTEKSAEIDSSFSYKCQAGKIYKITLPEDLLKYHDELECIFHAGLAPSKVPLGPLHGKVTSFGNTQKLNSILEIGWTGKFIEEMKCNGSVMHQGWNQVFNSAAFPFKGSIGKYSGMLRLHKDEYVDEKDSLLIDYMQDFSKLCPDYDSIVEKNKEKMTIIKQKPWNKGVFPFNQILDVTRIVGRQEDEGLIFLGKMYTRDIFRKDLEARVLVYFTMVSYDPKVSPEFKPGQNLPPLVNGFKFRVAELKDIMLYLIPFDNMLEQPSKTFRRMIVQTGKGFTNGPRFLWDFILGIGSSDAKRMSSKFLASLPSLNSTEDEFELALPHDKFSHPHTNEL